MQIPVKKSKLITQPVTAATTGFPWTDSTLVLPGVCVCENLLTARLLFFVPCSLNYVQIFSGSTTWDCPSVCVWELWVTYTHSTSRLQTMHLIMLWQTVVCKKNWTSSELVGATTHHSHIATVHFIYPVWKQNIVQNRALYGNYFWQGMLHYTYNLRLVWTGLREWNSYWYKTEQCTKLEITVVCQNYW